MRLIDADKLLLKFNKVYDEADAKYHESDFDSFWGGGCSMIQEVIKETAEQPTAYDVDDIVAKLEEIKNGHEKNICVYCAMDKAIEIVKAGGNS